MKKILDYFLEVNKIKDVKRYGMHHEIFKESVADHSFLMIVIATRLIDELNLDLDYKKVVKLISFHDMCEIGLLNDYDAVKASKDINYSSEKKETEHKTINNLSIKYGKDIKEFHSEYEMQITRESKFVKAIDKLETNIYEMTRGAKYFDDAEFIVYYPRNAVLNFPELIPFYKELLKYMKSKYIEAGLIWKKNMKFKIKIVP